LNKLFSQKLFFGGAPHPQTQKMRRGIFQVFRPLVKHYRTVPEFYR